VAGQQERFGERLRLHREAAGYSQEELAERAGLSANAISALERGERKRPYPDTLRRLGEALRLSEGQRSDLAAALRTGRDDIPASPRLSSAFDEAPDDLPDPGTPLIGREREAEVVLHLLSQSSGRLLTLTGPGGVGKTRLALHTVRRIRDRYSDGVAWVDLAPLTEPSLVLSTIAQAVGVQEVSGGDMRTALRSSLRARRMLLALDNVEHVLDATPDIAGLLRACPGLAMLTTSRAPLNVRGEQEYVVPPLELPTISTVRTVAEVQSAPSVQLFVWHAQQRDPTFELSQENATDVAAICRRLDGVPLALELAAARVRLLGPAGLLARLDRSLSILVGGARDLPTRQQTMEGAIGWSYDLLGPLEQAFFRRLSVFAGGWTLEAAEFVGATEAEAANEVSTWLSALIDQSLVMVTHGDQGARYGMLEPIRQYALERLEDRGEVEDTRRRHASHYVALAERAAREIEGRADQVAWLQRLGLEHDNMRAALAWSEHAPDGSEVGLRLGSALWRFWEMRGHAAEGGRWLASALARSDGLPLALRARALNGAGNLARRRAEHDLAITYHQQSLDISRQIDDRKGIARSLNNLGVVARDRGDAEQTLRLCEESLSLFRAVGDQHGAAIALISLGMAASQQGDYDGARARYEESLALFRASGDRWHIASVEHYLARLMVRQGDLNAARRTAEECLALYRATGDEWGVALVGGTFGWIAHARDDLSGAARHFADALQVAVEAGVDRAIPTCLEDLARVAWAVGQPVRAVHLAGAAAAQREVLGVPRMGDDGNASMLDLSALQHEPHATAWREGQALPRDQAVAEAMTLAAEIAHPASR
jgi:predicted ATPase/DNA-binding XRE family transcriptional regulator/Tfp pilus assembly protein PilF